MRGGGGLLLVISLPLITLAIDETYRRNPSPYDYPLLHGGAFAGPPRPESPDPLVRYQWASDFADKKTFQVFTQTPTRVLRATPATAFTGVETLLPNAAVTDVLVKGDGDIAVDFGTECAGWLEFDSVDFNATTITAAIPSSSSPTSPMTLAVAATTPTTAANVTMSLSEYTVPGFYNTGPKSGPALLARHGTFELRLNEYEGVRYGFIHVRNLTRPFHISAFRQVCQILPSNYAGAFASSDKMLDKVWWSGAYTVKVNMEPDFFNSILIDRGDRISWTGDAHVTQKLALMAFEQQAAAAVKNNIQRTSGPKGYNNIPSYALYWVLSNVDYFWATADESLLVAHYNETVSKLNTALGYWTSATPFDLRFIGTDDRIGGMFEEGGAPGEMARIYKLLGLQTVRAWAGAMNLCKTCTETMKRGTAALEDQANTLALSFVSHNQSKSNDAEGMSLSPPPPPPSSWMDQLYTHSAAAAVAANLTTPQDEAYLLNRFYKNPARWCSFSPFNSYFLLEAVSQMRTNAAYCIALSMVHTCWGGMVRLGATTLWETFSPEWNRIFEYGSSTPNGQTGYMSHAHPWAAGATPWLTSNVLGLKPTSPGWATFDVVPRFGFGFERAEGGVVVANKGCGAAGGNEATPLTSVYGFAPTPFGNISVQFSMNEADQVGSGIRRDGEPHFSSVVAKITMPNSSALTGRLGMPTFGYDVKVLVNGRRVAITSYDDDYVYITLQNHTSFDVSLDFDGSDGLRALNDLGAVGHAGGGGDGEERLPWVYSGSFVSADKTTGGDWISVVDGTLKRKYGTRGYSLFHFDGLGSNLTQVTPSVMAHTEIFHQSLSGAHAVHLFPQTEPTEVRWGIEEKNQTSVSGRRDINDDTRALLDPRNASGIRKLGAWSTSNPYACRQSIVLDVTLPHVSPSSPVRVSLYFVDFLRTGSQFAVEMRELESLELAAPTQAVVDPSETGDGIYLTFLASTSVRFRIMQITGFYGQSDADAYVSAVFFD